MSEQDDKKPDEKTPSPQTQTQPPPPKKDPRPGAKSKMCHCGAMLADHSQTAPFNSIVEGSECKAFNFDPTGGQPNANTRVY